MVEEDCGGLSKKPIENLTDLAEIEDLKEQVRKLEEKNEQLRSLEEQNEHLKISLEEMQADKKEKKELEEQNEQFKRQLEEVEVEKKEMDEVLEELRGIVQCPVCLSVPRQGGPVPVCRNGHFLCHTCKDEVGTISYS